MGQLRSSGPRQPLQPPPPQPQPPPCLSRTAPSPSPSSETNLSVVVMPWPSSTATRNVPKPNLELQLLTKPTTVDASTTSTKIGDDHSTTQLQLSIGSSETGEKADGVSCTTSDAAGLKEQAQEQLRAAMAEKAYAEEARQQARRQIELAEQEFTNAKRIRQQAQEELEKALALKEHATKQMNCAILEITCHSCKNKFMQQAASPSPSSHENSAMGLSYISSKLREWEAKKGDQKLLR